MMKLNENSTSKSSIESMVGTEAKIPAASPQEKAAVPFPRSTSSTEKKPGIASASLPDTLAALHVNPATGLTHANVETSRKEHGYNEVTEVKEHPVPILFGSIIAVREKGRKGT
jgi:hypothetical protein